MNKTFKISTFVLKLMIFAFIVASFSLSAVRAEGVSENEKMVMGQVRLSLWYQGIDSKNDAPTAKEASNEKGFGVEELDRAMQRYGKSEHSSSFDAKR